MRSGTSLAWSGDSAPGGASESSPADGQAATVLFIKTSLGIAIAIGSAKLTSLSCERLIAMLLSHGSSEQPDSW